MAAIDELELAPYEMIRITRSGKKQDAEKTCFHHFVSTGEKRESRFLLPRNRTEYAYRCEYCGKVRWSF